MVPASATPRTRTIRGQQLNRFDHPTGNGCVTLGLKIGTGAPERLRHGLPVLFLSLRIGGVHVAERQDKRVIARNRKAYHDYFIEETFEAGIELTGTEVRSLRENSCQLKDCFVLIRRREAWLHNVHIAPYSHGNRANVDPDRKRRLLLHKRQIDYLARKSNERGYSIVPTMLYFNERGLVKVEVALARGKKLYDKRESIAKKDAKRDIERALKDRRR